MLRITTPTASSSAEDVYGHPSTEGNVMKSHISLSLFNKANWYHLKFPSVEGWPQAGVVMRSIKKQHLPRFFMRQVQLFICVLFTRPSLPD